MPTGPLLRTTLLLASIAFAPVFLHAAQPKAVTDPKIKFAQQITEAKNNIGSKKEELRWVAMDFERIGDWGKSDLRILTNDYARVFSTWEKIGELYQAGRSQEALDLKATAKPSRDWRRRFEARLKQSELWPTEHWAGDLQNSWRGRQSRAFSPKWVEAKQNASMAWGRFADSIAPEVKPEERNKLEDAAYEAEAHAKAAEIIWGMREFEDKHELPAASPTLASKAKELRALEEELTRITQERLRADQRQRDWDRHRKQQQDEFTRIYQQTLEQSRRAK